MGQRQRILEYLMEGRTLTRLNAWDSLGILEAPARISELRAKGFNIQTELVEVTNRYGESVKIAEWKMGESSTIKLDLLDLPFS